MDTDKKILLTIDVKSTLDHVYHVPSVPRFSHLGWIIYGTREVLKHDFERFYRDLSLL